MGQLNLGGLPKCSVEKGFIMSAGVSDQHSFFHKRHETMKSVNQRRSLVAHFIRDPGQFGDVCRNGRLAVNQCVEAFLFLNLLTNDLDRANRQNLVAVLAGEACRLKIEHNRLELGQRRVQNFGTAFLSH
ncbi:hypothetical protein D3C73_1300900 [compost metagenome]